MKYSVWKPTLEIVGKYLIFGVLWISLTDPILHSIIREPDQFLEFELYKGWFFILATAGLLTSLLYSQLKARNVVLNDLNSTQQRLTLTNRELRTSTKRFKATFEQSAVGIAYAAENDHLMLCNLKWGQILGLSSEELIDRDYTEWIFPADLEKFKQLQQALKQSPNQSSSMDIRLLSHPPSPVWVTLVLTYISAQEEDSAYWILVINDIQRLMTTEEELRQLNDELEGRVEQRTAQLIQSNTELENFAYSVSHDLRAPLRAINGYTSILLEEFTATLDSEEIEMLEKIKLSSIRMDDLINDLLKYARLGRNTIKLKHIQLSDILNEVILDFNHQIKEMGATISLPSREELKDVCGDATLMHQVFSNLLDNALKYQPTGNRPKITITAFQEGNELVIHFCDNGIGISSEQFDRIFNIFQRLHDPDVFPGTGIGLAIVKKAVELMRGSISVESTPGNGACFILKLKVCPQDE